MNLIAMTFYLPFLYNSWPLSKFVGKPISVGSTSETNSIDGSGFITGNYSKMESAPVTALLVCGTSSGVDSRKLES